jgi:hypothetical protein
MYLMNDNNIVDNNMIFHNESILVRLILKKNDITLFKEYDFVYHNDVIILIYTALNDNTSTLNNLTILVIINRYL